MNFAQNAGISIQTAFEKYDRDHPNVYANIRARAVEAIEHRREKISIKRIVNDIRWDMYVPVDDSATVTMPGDRLRKFKVNDAYISRYARKLINEFPHFEPFIETRGLRS